MADALQKMLQDYKKKNKKLPSMAVLSKMVDEAKKIDKEKRKRVKLPAKLLFSVWVDKYFRKDPDHVYWTSEYERVEVGFAPGDMSRYSKADLKEEYQKYKKDENDFIPYEESTNEMVEDF